MDLEISLTGQASKRGALRRLRAPQPLVEEIGTWLHANADDTLRSTRLGEMEPGTPALLVDLHPAAEGVRIVATTDARVLVTAATAAVGPGYHTYLVRLLERLGEELGISWGEPDGGSDAVTSDPRRSERADVERRHLVWLRGTLQRVREARERGLGAVQLCRVDGDRFAFDGALATVLGPRDDDWLGRAIADPRVAIDVWPWWADAMDARYLLDRALSLMWTAVRWRIPALDGEAELLDEVVALLQKAYPLDPSLPYPWREWCELLSLGGPAYRPSAIVTERAAAATGPLVGYRRSPVTIVHDGWALEVPGSFAERWADGEWWGGEAGRAITLAAVPTGDGTRPMSPEAFLAQVAGGLGPDALTHRAGPVVGRARLGVDPSSGVEVAVLEGYSAVVGSGAALRVVIDDPADWEWALQMWRSLEPA
ncbi:MAG TPA: hypothetical protein VH720_01160 [Candidatus Limnocylindrales bacterium]